MSGSSVSSFSARPAQLQISNVRSQLTPNEFPSRSGAASPFAVIAQTQTQTQTHSQTQTHTQTQAGRNQAPAPPVAGPASTAAPLAATTLAAPADVKRTRFVSMDFNQKVNSLIESPVRAPLKSPAAAAKQPARQAATQAPTNRPANRRPIQQQQANFGQQAVARAQQAGSQTLNAGPARKSAAGGGQQQGYQAVQQLQFDNELDEQRAPQQQQQTFDESAVQTSTAMSPAAGYSAAPSRQQPLANGLSANNRAGDKFAPQQQQLVIQSGGGPDGSSAITTQFDTILSANQNNQQPESSPPASSDRNNYDSALDDPNNASDDFRSAGAKAAASHNQNWYIMRTI